MLLLRRLGHVVSGRVAQGHRIGLVDHLVDSLDELMPRCEEIAEQVRPLPDACSPPPADVFLSLGQVGLSAPLAVQTIKKVAMAGLSVGDAFPGGHSIHYFFHPALVDASAECVP